MSWSKGPNIADSVQKVSFYKALLPWIHTCILGCVCVVRNGCPGFCKNCGLGGKKGRGFAEPGWLKWSIPWGWMFGLTGLSLENTGCCPCWLYPGPGWLKGRGFWVGTGCVLLRSGGGGGGAGPRCSNKWWLGNLGSVKPKYLIKWQPSYEYKHVLNTVLSYFSFRRVIWKFEWGVTTKYFFWKSSSARLYECANHPTLVVPVTTLVWMV